MSPILLVIAALTASSLATGPSKCDKTIVNEIKSFWDGKAPKNIVQTAKSNGKEIVLATTKNYYPDNVKSKFSYFVQEKANPLTRVDIYDVLKDGTLQSKYIHQKEESGSTFDPVSKIRRYQVYQDATGGVTGYYACSEASNAKAGTPAGIVKVRAFDYDKDSFQLAKNLLETVGVTVSVSLTDPK